MTRPTGAVKPHDPAVTAKHRLEKETGAVYKDHAGRLTVALVYPNVYEVGMSNLGYHKIYHLLNRRDDTACERVFLPSREEVEFLHKHKRPITSLESGKPLNRFDIIAFSITFEPDYLNVLTILNMGGIPLRYRRDRRPLVIAGGLAMTMNPEPLAPFIDMAVIGEGEKVIDQLCDAAIRGASLPEFAAIPGVYVPSGYLPADGAPGGYQALEGYPAKVARQWDIDSVYQPNVSVIDTEDTIFGDMALVEIGKGCGKHCRFCAAGYSYRPTRHIDTASILAAVDAGLDRRNKVGLVGSAIGDHPDVGKIFEHIIRRGGEFSVSSLRMDKITPAMLTWLAAGNCRTITLAPEAGTDRLRRVIGKDITNETIIKTIHAIAETGEFHLKLYFLVGLPWETDEDVAGIETLVRAISDEMKRAKGKSVTVGVDGFVPKAFTPFQWAAFAGIKPVQAKIDAVHKAVKPLRNVTVQAGSARQSYIQAVLSMGDRRVAEIIEIAARNDGDWFRAFRESGIDTDAIVLRDKTPGDPLPWDMFDHRLHPGYLEGEYKKAAHGKVTAQCPPSGTPCKRCGDFAGVCDRGR